MPPTDSSRFPTRAAERGFSLMEVVTSLSVISFALVALLGVFPIGLENSRTTVNETRASQLGRMIFATLRSEPFEGAPCFGKDTLDLSTLSTFDDGQPTVIYVAYPGTEEPQIERAESAMPEAIYRVELRFRPEIFPESNPVRVTGSTVQMRMFGLGAQASPIFESSSFIGRSHRVGFTR